MGDRQKAPEGSAGEGHTLAAEPQRVDPSATVPGPRAQPPSVSRAHGASAAEDVASAETVQVDTPPGSGPPSHPSPTVFAGREHAPVFAPGDLIGGRYRVLRFVAAGGMGQVYEVRDEELDVRLALKTVHPQLAGHSTVAQQFKREIQLARKVTHPGVCRIYDLGYHRFADGGTTAFLTMELLEGETLRERLARGPMSSAEATGLAAQLARGLAAAHAQRVIHRDFKSDNVILVRGSDGVRAVITDFGVAVADAEPEASGAGGESAVRRGFVGTPAYIAPELVKGGEATDAADLYSFGVVLFEMLAGRLPFEGDGPIGVAMARLDHDPPDLRTLVPGVSPALNVLVDACLLRQPDARRAAATPLLAALMGGPPAKGLAGWRRAALIAGVVAVATALTGGWLVWRERSLHALAPAMPRLIAPITLKGLRVHVRPPGDAPGREGTPTALGLVFREALRAELLGLDEVRVSRFFTVRGVDAAFQIARGPLTSVQAQRLAAASFAEVVIDGVIQRDGDGFRVAVRLIDGRSGQVVREVQGRGADVREVARQVVRQLGGALGRGPRPDGRAFDLLPATPQAQLAYGELLVAVAEGRTSGLLRRLDALLVGGDRFASGLWLRAELASAEGEHDVDGLFAEAKVELDQLPEDDALMLESQAAQLASTGIAADVAARCSARAASDPLDGQLQLDMVGCLITTRQTLAARAVLDELLARTWRPEQQVQIEASAASQAAGERDARRFQEYVDACVRGARQLGDRRILAVCLAMHAANLESVTRWGEAADLAVEAEALALETGDAQVAASARAVVWRSLRSRGRLLELAAYARAALVEEQRLRGGDSTALLELSLASVLADVGHLGEARKLFEERLVPYFLRSSNTGITGYAQCEASRIALMAGDVAAATRHGANALTLLTAQRSEPRLQAFARVVLAQALVAAGELTDARDQLILALRYREGAGLWRVASQVKVALAELDLLEGQTARAEAALAALLLDPRAELTDADRAHVQAVRALALVALGQMAAAREAAAEAFSLAHASELLSLALEVGRVQALVMGLEGDVASARAALATLRRRAESAGAVVETLELDLTLARIERMAGRGAVARRVAHGVARAARGPGLVTLAREAEALARD